MAQPEMERQVRQQRADIDSLYELTDAGFTAVNRRLDEVDQRFDAVDRRFDQLGEQLAEILRRLPGQ